jgi:hypothetical protein
LSREREPRANGVVSPDRTALNQRWDLRLAFDDAPTGAWSRLLRRFGNPLRRLAHFLLGPVVERQVEMNSAQVQFDNQIVAYLDRRVDLLSNHYDEVLGLYGKRMEEIDERHLALQQELIRHVHELVKRIEFVFETAEQSHLQAEALIRELREDLRALAGRVGSLGAARGMNVNE